MLKSMTGYGLGSISKDNYEISAEIKTLNSKFADVSIRIPQQWSSLELILRKLIIDALVRGKINVNIEIIGKKDNGATLFDEELLDKYYKQFKTASDKLASSDTDLFSLALHAPGVLNTGDDNILEADISEAIKQTVLKALENCNDFRTQEGGELQNKLSGYIKNISDLSAKIDTNDKQRIAKVEEKMRLGLANSKVKIEIDNNRFEQELIYYIEKLDISEEKVRLANHISYYSEVMAEDQPNGKKLGFIAQEIGREINTIGSKANNADIQRIVVEMKEELEKVKEQVLNVL
jgi:uncharacterized protein (TIGR00255 family)